MVVYCEQKRLDLNYKNPNETVLLTSPFYIIDILLLYIYIYVFISRLIYYRTMTMFIATIPQKQDIL